MRAFDLPDEAATRRLGECLGRLCEPGDVILLEGELGVGKTTLVQGFAVAQGVAEAVTSPTFALLHEIAGRAVIRHMDLYRLESDQLEHLGIEEWFAPDAIVVVEWADRLGPYMPRERLRLVLSHQGDGRRAELTAIGTRHEWLLGLLAPQPS